MRKPIIAIDGPAGAGKSTVARGVAAKLGYLYIDTGAMYRAVAVKAAESRIPLDDPDRIVDLANNLDIYFLKEIDGAQHIFTDGDDLTEAVRTPEATRLSSPVSAIPGVRHRLVELQRKMGAQGGVVMEGRDIGTYVFPDAEVKIFLTASPEERARRRHKDLEAAGIPAEVEKVAAEIRERDQRDSSRAMAPLRKADDAALIDTDDMSVEEVVQKVIDIHDSKVKECCTG
ncbi:MAG: (d)CMP kinase [Armatimonadetes bacterium]|nr:(d)CMP kinase [Armatimonadota bacterium]